MTRHTFIAWALSEGANLKGLAEYCDMTLGDLLDYWRRTLRFDAENYL